MKIKHLKKRDVWQVDFGTKVPHVKDPDGNGKLVGRRTSRWKSKSEAQEWAGKVLREDRNRDLSLSADEKMVFKQATQMLNDGGFGDVSLTAVVADWLKYRTRIVSDKNVEECYELWIEAYRDKAKASQRSDATTSDLKRIKRFLDPFLSLNIGELEQPQIAEELAKHIRATLADKKLVTLRNGFVKCKQFISWCKKKDVKLLPADTPNPLDGLAEVEVPSAPPPYIVSIEELQEIMHAAQATDARCHLLPFFILHCLCGCRPSEVLGMTWENIHIEDPNEPFVYIPERSSGKNKQARKLDLKEFPAVVEWFKVCDWSKPFFPYKLGNDGKMERRFYNNRRSVLAEAVVLDLNATEEESDKFDDFGRHSCATALYAGRGWTPKDIADRIGNTSKVLMKHYINSTRSKAELEEYFKVLPTKLENKLVKFAG